MLLLKRQDISTMRNLIILVLLFPMSLWAQRGHLDAGDEFYAQKLYKEAITEYQLALEEKVVVNRFYLTQQVAKTYHRLFDYENAAIWYEKLMEFKDDNSAENIYEYGQLLRNLGRYEEAKKVFDNYLVRLGSNELKDELYALCDWPLSYSDEEEFPKYHHRKTTIETGGRSMGYDFYNSGLMVGLPQKSEDESQTVFYDLSYTATSDSIAFNPGESLPGAINHSFYEGAPSISSDGKTMYYTANASEIKKYKIKKKEELEISDDGTNILKIFVAYNVNGKWSNPSELNINSNENNTAFPHLSKDGKTLFYCSDKVGGKGRMDIYFATKINDSTWSNPTALSPLINTFEHELYPYLSDNKLYFTSKGLPGFGGSDLFVADWDKGKVSNVKNLGKKVNSQKDDFALIWENEAGFYSSNREGTHGYDHIYFLKRENAPAPIVMDTISGYVVNSISEEPIKDVLVSLYEKDENGNLTLVESKKTDDKGYWEFIVHPDKEYIVKFDKDGYNLHEAFIPKDNGLTPSNRDEVLTKLNPLQFKPKAEKDNILTLNNIYFEFNSAALKQESQKILDKLAAFLKENPNAKVELGAHTDAVGKNDYNLRLSQKRANSCVDYLISRGVSKDHLIPKGYGETKILNGCVEWNSCSEEENKVNRRVEIKFL